MIELLSKQKIYSDGFHNAFSDLILYRDKYYLVFRSASSHLSFDGRIVILGSDNGETWEREREYSFPDCTDAGGSKFFILKDRLYCISRIMFIEKNTYRTKLIINSTDGKFWTKIRKIYRKNFVNWRVKTDHNASYSAFYTFDYSNEKKWKVLLVKSVDGFKWENLSTIYNGDAANETDIEFIGDKLIAVIRRETRNTVLAKSHPPYKLWKYYDIGRQLHSPCIKKIGKKIILGVRDFEVLEEIEKLEIADTTIEKRKQSQKVSLWEWDGKTFFESLVIEKGKNIDSGYLGIEIDKHNKNCALISYYLGSTKVSDIWVARVKIY